MPALKYLSLGENFDREVKSVKLDKRTW